MKNILAIQPGDVLWHKAFDLKIKVLRKSTCNDGWYCEVIQPGFTLKKLGSQAHYSLSILNDDRLVHDYSTKEEL